MWNILYVCTYTKWISRISYQQSKINRKIITTELQLPTSCWGYAVLHATDLIQIRYTAYPSPL
jgi:hypothetical protein